MQTDDEILALLTPHATGLDLPPAILDRAVTTYREILGLPYERIAILMALQAEMFTNLTNAIDDAARKQKAGALVKGALIQSPIIKPRRFNSN